MKRHANTPLVTLIFVSAILLIQLAAESQTNPQNKQTHYIVKRLSTLGGTYGTAQQMNSNGVISGDANLAGDTTEHATIWRDGIITDLGTLGGLNSAGGQVNEQGLILGVSETASIDPLAENWGLGFTCSASGSPCNGAQNLVMAVTWQAGVITSLPTLGGNNGSTLGVGTALNNKGEAVGWAENSTRDPDCIPPQVLHWEAVVWGPSPGEIHELPPFPSDSVGAAAAINENGQVVGATGTCGPPSSSFLVHPVLWQNGVATNLGGLGGLMNNAALSINNRGQIVGTSDLPGDMAFHGFLWQDGIITDLAPLAGDSFSFAYGINDEGQVIAQSCDINFNCRATLWQNGIMTDLNTLTPPGSLYLVLAQHINNQGEITGQGFDPSTGDTPAFVAIPCDSEHISGEGCQGALAAATESPRVVLPERVRNWLRQRRFFGHF